MDNCPTCGASLPANATWCGQCFAPRAAGNLPATARFPGMPGAATVQSTPLPPPVVRSRWRKTQTTFGPVGRVIATVCLIVPFLIMLIGGIIGDFFALGGAAIWLVVILPWGMRDVWKAGQVVGPR